MDRGGSVDIPQRNWSQEWPGIKQGYKGQENQYRQFANKEPLLKGATNLALSGISDVKGLSDPLRALLSNIGGADFTSSLQNVYKTQIEPVLQRGGALTPEQQREAEQASLGLSAGAGMANSNAGIANALLNRDQFRRQRFGEALGEAGSILSDRGQDIAQRLGLTSGIQGVTSSAIAPALQTEEERVGSFSKLTNPILAYMSDLFSSNQNAAAAQSIAGANKSSGATGGALGAVGSIVGAVLPALLSDEDLKTNIKETGRKTNSGIQIKRWQYKGDDRWFEGPIAQDVEKVHPEAVGRSRVTGHRFVDLEKTDVPFRLVNSALLTEI